MAALVKPLRDIPSQLRVVPPSPQDALAHLAAVHAEATETAHLANLLSRSLHVAILLTVVAAATVLLSADTTAPALAWLGLVGLATGAIIVRYARAIVSPFEHATLKLFASDLNAALLYAGFAFGAGAFLVLPEQASGSLALLFALMPSLMVAILLHENRASLFFLAPVAALMSLACVLRPFADGFVAGALVALACAVMGGALHLMRRQPGDTVPAGLLATK